VDPEGVVSALGLARAASDERPIGEALIAEDLHARPTWPTQGLYGPRVGAALAGGIRGALVAATPYDDSRRACSQADRRWALASLGKRQIIEGVIGQLSRISSPWSATGPRRWEGC
jgi:hypothetical protein